MKNIAIAGLGKQGMIHLDALLRLKDENKIKIVAVCDKNKDFLQALSKKEKVESFFNHKEMISKCGDKIDLLILALPNNIYSELIFDSNDKKFSILKEKPFATSVNEAIVYRYIQQKRNIKIHTAQQRFFSKSYIYAKKCINDGLLGKLLFFDYQYSLNDKKESWYWDQEAGGGCWLNVGWHMIFVISWFFGKPDVVNVNKIKTQRRSWEYETDDTVMFSCGYKNGFVGKGFVSVTDIAKEKRIKIAGDKGYLIIINNRVSLYNNNDEIIDEIIDEKDVEIYKKQIMSFIEKEKMILELEDYNKLTMDIINSY